MRLYLKKAIQDILSNRFMHTVSIVTIILSILIVSTFALFFINASDIMNAWKKGVRIIVYLKDDTAAERIAEMKTILNGLYGVQSVQFVPKAEALALLQSEMPRQSSILKNLSENPLPDSFELRMIPASQNWEKAEALSSKIEDLPEVESVEYGQRWLEKFTSIYNLFRLAGYTMGILFMVAAIFIVANTIRLLLYARREEVEIMRLVGATDRFITTPFYIESLIQGALGGCVGLGVLYVLYIAISANVTQGLSGGLLTIRFLSPGVVIVIFFSSLLVGWLGCFLALKQYLKVYL